MPALIFKAASCMLKTKNYGMVEIKGDYEINIIDNDLVKELRECNPEIDMWIDKGYLTINESKDTAQADGLLMQEKAADENKEKALEQAKETIENTYKEAIEQVKASEKIEVKSSKKNNK